MSPPRVIVMHSIAVMLGKKIEKRQFIAVIVVRMMVVRIKMRY